MKLSDFALAGAEKALIAGLASGEVVIGPGRFDATAADARQIGAAFPHFVFAGARITGALDLEGRKLDHDLALFDCHLGQTPFLRSTRLDNLALNDSFLPGLEADRLEARGSIFLRGVEAEGEVRLPGAFARWFLWAQIAFGWALSLLAVAGFSGLIRRA